MSDAHHEDEGAHEIDKMPNRRLFNLLVGLSALTLLACIGVVQLFNLQVDSIASERAARGAYSRTDYEKRMQEMARGYGVVTVIEPEDRAETVRYHVPLDKARAQVLEDAELLGGTPPYRGWEKLPIGQAVAKEGGLPKPGSAGPKPTDGEGEPTEGAGEEPEPADEEPEPADEEPEPAQDEPAKPEPADDEPAKPEPAEDEPEPNKDAEPAKPEPAGDEPAPDPKKPQPAEPETPEPEEGKADTQ